MEQYDVIIIGAGGAGLMCASVASRRDKKVLVIDHNQKIGRKIIISGGGRCNFTNLYASSENYLCKNPHFVKSALAKYTPYDFLELVHKYKIEYYDKQHGALFCKTSSSEILNMLLAECKNTTFKLSTTIKKVVKDSLFEIYTSNGNYKTQSLVIATGGLSIPKLGASGFGYEIAQQFSLKVIPPKPALDGFKLSSDDLQYFKELAGVSTKTLIKCRHKIFNDPILFTHQGLSGPASLKASLYWQENDVIKIDWLPNIDFQEIVHNSQSLNIENLLNTYLPKRLTLKFLEKHNLANLQINQLKKQNLKDFIELLHNYEIKPISTIGYQKAEVTKYGVDTDGLLANSMEVKSVKGLYFIGEVIDVTGELGGYNFQWAWSSGYAAGLSV